MIIVYAELEKTGEALYQHLHGDTENHYKTVTA
jgi:hypothetical protein